MYSYITEELPQTVFAAFPQLDAGRVSITGHSMGGHGALTLVCTTSTLDYAFTSESMDSRCISRLRAKS